MSELKSYQSFEKLKADNKLQKLKKSQSDKFEAEFNELVSLVKQQSSKKNTSK